MAFEAVLLFLGPVMTALFVPVQIPVKQIHQEKAEQAYPRRGQAHENGFHYDLPSFIPFAPSFLGIIPFIQFRSIIKL